MFTGIITHTGTIIQKDSGRFTIGVSSTVLERLEKGTSIAVDGICLTVVDLDGGSFSVDVMPETIKRTNLETRNENETVNIELPATPTTLLSGHIVQGHVDGTATLEAKMKQNNSYVLTFVVSRDMSKFIVEKGSVAVNGISLTVITSDSRSFTVGIIPYTWEKTNIRIVKPGEKVNIELDIIAKYIDQLKKHERQ